MSKRAQSLLVHASWPDTLCELCPGKPPHPAEHWVNWIDATGRNGRACCGDSLSAHATHVTRTPLAP